MQLSCENWFNDLVNKLQKKDIQYYKFCIELENFDSNDFNTCNNHNSHHKKYYEKIIFLLWLKSKLRGNKWNTIQQAFHSWEETEKNGLDFINSKELKGIQIKTLRNNIYYRQDRKITKNAFQNPQETPKIIKENLSSLAQPLKIRSKIVSAYPQGFLNIMESIKYENLPESIKNILIIYVPQFISNVGFDLFNKFNKSRNKIIPDFAVKTKEEFFEMCSTICFFSLKAKNPSRKLSFEKINILYFQDNKVYSENLLKPIYLKESVIEKWRLFLIEKSYLVSNPAKYNEKMIKNQLKKQAI